MIACWDIVPCSLIEVEHFRGAYCLHHQGDKQYMKNWVVMLELVREGTTLTGPVGKGVRSNRERENKGVSHHVAHCQ
jgi:hypothetical protein